MRRRIEVGPACEVCKRPRYMGEPKVPACLCGRKINVCCIRRPSGRKITHCFGCAPPAEGDYGPLRLDKAGSVMPAPPPPPAFVPRLPCCTCGPRTQPDKPRWRNPNCRACP